jgi:hypothetical protein
VGSMHGHPAISKEPSSTMSSSSSGSGTQRSTLLEDFRKKSSKKFEFKDVVGHFVEFRCDAALFILIAVFSVLLLFSSIFFSLFTQYFYYLLISPFFFSPVRDYLSFLLISGLYSVSFQFSQLVVINMVRASFSRNWRRVRLLRNS